MCRNTAPSRVDKHFRKLQLVSAAAYSLGHGGNDAQKTMGIIAGVLYAGGLLSEFTIPFWVVLAAHAAISLGTLAGGWRIIHTMGSKITRLQPVGGFAAETAGAISLFTATGTRRAGEHHAHHHRRDHRRRFDATAVGGALGRRRSDRVGVDPDHSDVGRDRRHHVVRALADRLAVDHEVHGVPGVHARVS